MGTLTLATIRALIRSEINEATITSISDSELNYIINDGYKDTAIKSLCYESLITKTNIPKSVRFVPLAGCNIVNVNHVEYNLGTSSLGMISVTPHRLGHIPINGSSPQFWFRWGNYLVIEPLPDVATYDLDIYASCYPVSGMSFDTDLPSYLPTEFHECIYLYALSFACLKFRRWGDAAAIYNRYIESVQIKKVEYIMKSTERGQQDIPAKVVKQ